MLNFGNDFRPVQIVYVLGPNFQGFRNRFTGHRFLKGSGLVQKNLLRNIPQEVNIEGPYKAFKVFHIVLEPLDPRKKIFVRDQGRQDAFNVEERVVPVRAAERRPNLRRLYG